MADIKAEKLATLRQYSEEFNDTQKRLAEAFKEAADAKATAQELSNETGLSVEQVRYFASKNHIRITPAQRGPKVR